MRIFCIVIFLAHRALFGQICHLQDFPGNWHGDVPLFLSSGSSIRSQGNAATETIGIFKEIQHASSVELEVHVKLDFALSTSNYLRWVVAADSSNPHFTKALLVKWNGSNKNLQLQAVDGSSTNTLISGVNNRLAGSGKQTKVKLTVSGNVATLYSDTSGNGVWQKEGECVFAGFPGKWSGFVFSHTSTRADKLELINYCTAAPSLRVLAWKMLAADSLFLSFTTKVDTNTVPELTPVAIKSFKWNGDTSIVIALNQKINPDQPIWIFIGSVQSADGDRMLSDSVMLEWKRIVNFREIRISEILADPSENGPNEFVEIYNTMPDTITLKKWKLCDATSCATIPDVRIPPQTFLVFSSESTFLQILSFPSLNNGGDSLRLLNENGTLIDRVNYSASWWQGVPQDGRSIEILDPNSRCEGTDLWKPCKINHTAGMKNSVHLDSLKDAVEAIREYNGAILLKFTLPMKVGEASVVIDGISYEGKFSNPNEWISNAERLSFHGTITISHPELSSCKSSDVDLAYETQLLERPEHGDIRISEILFNPVAYGYDYVEIQNISGHSLFVDTLFVSNKRDTSVFVMNDIFERGSSLVWTEDSSWVMSHYSMCDTRWIEEDLPTFPDSAGRIQLWTSRELDEISYHEDWHNALLEDKESISMERIQYSGPDQYQWISCAKGGRPGCLSPDYGAGEKAGFACSSSLLSPDGDGRDDLMFFSWQGQEHLVRASLKIYSLSGIMVKELLSEELWEKDQLVVWDGSGKEGMLPADWYVAELLSENEHDLKRYRKLVAIIYP